MTQPPGPDQPRGEGEPDESTRIRPVPFPPRTPGAPPTPQRTGGAGPPAAPPPYRPGPPGTGAPRPSGPPPSWAPGAPPPRPPQWQPPSANPYGYPGQGGPPSSGPGTGQPSGVPAGASPAPARPGRGRRLALLGVVAAAVVLLVAGAVTLFVGTGSGGVTVRELHRGDCLASGSVGRHHTKVSDVSVVSCGRAHVAQVVATTTRHAGTPADACVQAITDLGTSVAALTVSGHQVRPLSEGDRVACLVVGKDLKGSLVTSG